MWPVCFKLWNMAFEAWLLLNSKWMLLANFNPKRTEQLIARFPCSSTVYGFLIDFTLASVTRRQTYKILKHHCSVLLHHQLYTFFAERIVNIHRISKNCAQFFETRCIWKCLPYELWHSWLLYSLSAFKRTIEPTDFSRFLCFPEFSWLHEY